MMKWNRLLVFTSCIFAVSAAPLSLLPLSNLTKPSEDPFYSPESGYEKLNLGDVINYRKVNHPFGIFVFEEKVKSTYQFLVRSEDSLGNPTAIVTTLFVPHNADPKKLLSYQVAEDAPNIDCSPSYAMQLGSRPETWVTGQIELALSEAGMYEGWYVVVPDFLGPRSSFAAGFQAAHATLDSIKAVLQSGDLTGIDPNAEVALWGYSGGSQPSAWGAALAPTYAPEINIIGAAVGGILVDPISIAGLSMDTAWAGLITSAVVGLANEYPELMSFLKTTMYPEVQDAFFASTKSCLLGNVGSNMLAKWSDVSHMGESILSSTIAKNVTFINNLLNLDARPQVPLFFYNTINDEIIPAADADKLYDKWCSEGVSIEYHQDIFSEHITQVVAGAGGAFEWLKDRFKGIPQVQCHKRSSLSNAFNVKSLSGLSTIAVDLVSTVMDKDVGPTKSAGKNNSTSTSTDTGFSSLSSFLISSVLGFLSNQK